MRPPRNPGYNEGRVVWIDSFSLVDSIQLMIQINIPFEM